mgnify:CR=1 FL=1
MMDVQITLAVLGTNIYLLIKVNILLQTMQHQVFLQVGTG